MFEFMVMRMFHHCFRGVYGQTQMYTLEIQLTNLIIATESKSTNRSN